jgi:CRISPR system Cascade subunit CasC
MFIQIHTLTGYAGVLLNRDDTGMAKRLTYGDAVRTRTSSQFAKRKIRKAQCDFSMDQLGDVSVRSRETFKREIAQKLIAEGRDESKVIDVTLILMDAVFPPSEKAKKERKATEAKIAKGEATRMDLLERGEINVLSLSEIKFLKGKVAEFAALDGKKATAAAEAYVKEKESKANLRLAGQSMSLDIAMFGRMVTGDMLSNVDAAVHVAHAITTHSQQVETDFFTAVDDLVTGDEDNGGGHLGEVEITSPMLYGYYVVDWNQLLCNLQGVDNRQEVASSLSRNLIRLVSEYVVGAKKGGTAPYSSADLVMVEIGKGQPRTLAEAFRKKVGPTLDEAVTAMGAYLSGKDRMYGTTADRLVASHSELDGIFGTQMPVAALAEAVGARMKQAA